MRIIFNFLIFVGIISLAMMIQTLIIYLRPRIYPPKKLLRSRVMVFGSVGLICLLLGIAFSALS